MFCPIYKWKISQALDSGKSISGLLQRHLQRCDSCREYAAFCTSLKPKFIQDRQAILDNFDEDMNKKIMAAIPDRPEQVSGQRQKTRSRSWASRRPALIPSLAAAVSVLVIVIGIYFIARPVPEKTPPIGQISSLISAASPEDMLSKMESPLEKEYTELKRAFESTGKYLISSLDFRLGQQAK
jgi:hypothetical protein